MWRNAVNHHILPDSNTSVNKSYFEVNSTKTTKSSCMNARGIPTAAYQVPHMLSYPGCGGGGG